jgi:hypothetical protein
MIDRAQLSEPGNVVIEDERDLDALTRWAKSAKDGGTRHRPASVSLPSRARPAG